MGAFLMSGREIRAKRGRWVAVIGALIGLAVVSPVLPSASAAVLPVSEATGYDYSPGEPAIGAGMGGTALGMTDRVCTGGYAIAGDSGFFLTTVRTCSGVEATTDGTVRGDAGYYADMFANRRGEPLVLLRMRPGNDAHQLIVDPTTGDSPGGGYIHGWTRTVDQHVGMLVGKMGVDTGWTEGRILGIARLSNSDVWLLCTDAAASGGDIGGPVWRWDSTGLRALGTVVAVSEQGGACYRPIQETLYEYGAYLPSFGPDQGRPSWGTFAPGMVYYDGFVTWGGGRSIEKGNDWRL